MTPARSRLSRRDLLRVGSLGLRSRRVRALLSALGISIGIAAIVGVLGISQSSKGRPAGRAGPARQPDHRAARQHCVRPADRAAHDLRSMVARIGPVTHVTEIGSISSAYVYRNPLIPAVDTSGISLTAADAALPPPWAPAWPTAPSSTPPPQGSRRSCSAPRRPACSASTTWPAPPRCGSAATGSPWSASSARCRSWKPRWTAWPSSASPSPSSTSASTVTPPTCMCAASPVRSPR